MGGICGTVLTKESGIVEASRLQEMLHAFGLRANNEIASFVSGRIGFGAQEFSGKLSGIAQLIDHGNRHLLVFHGTIYNLKEITGEVSSSQAILEKFLCLSLRGIEQFLVRLRGEFALAVWDANQEILWLACDRFRIHPLFFLQENGRLVFASRMQAILDSRTEGGQTVAPESVVDLVSQSFIPTPRTIFQEVEKLPPGSLLRWSQGKSQVKRYWDISFLNPLGASRSELMVQLKQCFADSVNVRVKHAGVEKPIGSFLSGGIDSSTIVGVLSRLGLGPVKSYTIGFDEQPFNEVEFARCAARAFSSEHHEYFVSPKDVYDLVPQLIEAFDEPYANASAIPTYYCAKLAKEQGSNALFAGDGGDELFAGNERYAAQRVFDYYKVFPEWMRQFCIEPTLSFLSGALPWQILHKGMKYIRRANIPYPDRLFSWGLFETMPMNQVFSTDFVETLGERYDLHAHLRQLYGQAPARNELDRQLYIDLNLAISDNDVFKVTRMAELNGLTVYFPFLDHQLAEFAASVPAPWKMDRTQLRTFFKQTYADMLPREILTKGKHGFALPIPVWLKTDKNLREMMMDLVGSKRLQQRGYFSKNAIQKLLDYHKQDTTSFFGTILWNIVILELWLRRYCDKQ